MNSFRGTATADRFAGGERRIEDRHVSERDVGDGRIEIVEVGSDLIILQKDTHKEGLTEDEKLFAQTGMLHGVSTNLYFIEHGEQILAQ